MYYYLAASLPPVALGEPPPWTPEDFLFHAQGALSSDDHRELALIVEGRAGEGASDFAAWWDALDTQIRNTQARIRAGRLSVDSRPWLRMHSGFDVSVEQAVTDAMNQSDPLEREMDLDRCRWKALDERILGKRFGFEEILAYAIRLRLLARHLHLTDEAGLARIEQFISENVEQSLELQRLGGA